MTRSAYDVLSELRQRERDVDDLRAELARVLEPAPGLDALARDIARHPAARRLTREAVDEVLEVRLTPDGERALDEELGAVIDVDEHEDHLDLLDGQVHDLRQRLDNELGARADSFRTCSEQISGLDDRLADLEAWRSSWSGTATELVGRVAKVEQLERDLRAREAEPDGRVKSLESPSGPLDRVGAELELHKRLKALEAWRETLASAYPHIGDPRAS